MISYILAIICGLAVIGIDQFTKWYIISNYTLGQSSDFIKGFIDITYIHNTGAAWGMLNGHTWVLLSLTVVVMLICIALLLKWGVKNKFMFWAVTFVISGGIGNLIDRLFRSGNVIDFLHFEFFPQFPVFNIADSAIVLGAGLMIIYFVLDTVNDSKSKKLKTEFNSNSDNADN